MINVYLDTNPLKSGHAARGIGSYTQSLVDALKSNNNVKLVDSLLDSDIIHYPYFDLFFHTLPLDKLKPVVVTIHDVIPLIYPQYYPSGVRGRLNFKLQKYSLRSTEAVITDTECSKKDIVRFLDVPQEKINTIHLASKPIFKHLVKDNWKRKIINRYGLPKNFVLYVGDVNYNKNLLRLADACNATKIPLVIVGKQATNKEVDFSHVENKPFKDFLNKYYNDEDVRRIGYVQDEDLVKIYNLASLYCQSSLYEGFGLPILEAMACGCPVVISKTQALVEVADGAAYVVNAMDQQLLSECLTNIINNEDRRNELIQKGFERIKHFSWDITAQKTISVYKKILTV